MTEAQCRGTTAEGRRCRNRGACPHHAGRGAAKGWPTYNPAARPSRVKDTGTVVIKQKWPTLPATDGERELARIDELHRQSAELSDAFDVGWGEFFRTLFRRKR